jgi:hypothetical protein
MNRALLVGINKYPDAPLCGCVNDVTDMAAFLVARCGFGANEIRLLTDKRATTTAIKERLAWLVRGAKRGDRLVFHYSGHGAQVATRNKAEEVDGLDEVICPVDFDWSDRRMIRDKDFQRMFAPVPAGVDFVWISDSCHAGDLSRDMPPPGDRRRCLFPPEDIAWRNCVGASIGTRGLGRAAAKLNVALIAGCRSNQSSSDGAFDDRPNGVLTYCLLRALRDGDGMAVPLTKLIARLRAAVKRAGYEQVPQLEGSAALKNRSFLGLHKQAEAA